MYPGLSFLSKENPKSCLSQQWYSFNFLSLPSVVFCQSVVCGPASAIIWELVRMQDLRSYSKPTESEAVHKENPLRIYIHIHT